MTSDSVKFALLYEYVKAMPLPSGVSPGWKVYGRKLVMPVQKPFEGGSLLATL